MFFDKHKQLNEIIKHSFMKSRHFSIIPPSQYKCSPLESLDIFKRIYDNTLKEKSYSNPQKVKGQRKARKTSNGSKKNMGIFFNQPQHINFLEIPELLNKRQQNQKNKNDFKAQMLKLNQFNNGPKKVQKRKLSKRSHQLFSDQIEKNLHLINLKGKKKSTSRSRGKNTLPNTMSQGENNNYLKSFLGKFERKVKKSPLMDFYRPRLSQRDVSISSTLQTSKTFFENSEESNDMVKTLRKIKDFDAINVTDSVFRKNIRQMCIDLAVASESKKTLKSLEVQKQKPLKNQSMIEKKNSN